MKSSSNSTRPRLPAVFVGVLVAIGCGRTHSALPSPSPEASETIAPVQAALAPMNEDSNYEKPVFWDPPDGYPDPGQITAVDRESGEASFGTFYPTPLDLYLRDFQVDCQSHSVYLFGELSRARKRVIEAEDEAADLREEVPAWVWSLAAGSVGLVSGTVLMLAVQR